MSILKESLFIFDSISFVKQRSLRRKGIIDWEDLYLKGKNHFSEKRWNIIEKEVKSCMENYKSKNLEFFKNFIDEKYHFLLLEDFPEYVAYLDIETTGTNKDNEITLIGISDSNKKYRILVKDINLMEYNIFKILSKYSIIVTFYGKNFDIPMIKMQFPDLSKFLDSMIIVDLYYLGRMVGFKGGLKKIEKQVGIHREKEIDGLTGYHAVMLWKDYKEGNRESLIKLIRYNRADVINIVDISNYMLTVFYDMYIRNFRYPYP